MLVGQLGSGWRIVNFYQLVTNIRSHKISIPKYIISKWQPGKIMEPMDEVNTYRSSMDSSYFITYLSIACPVVSYTAF